MRVLLAEREWEQKDLAERTTLSARTISELYNNKTKSYTKHAIDELVNVFDIKDMNELDEIKAAFEQVIEQTKQTNTDHRTDN
ncbi:helix-turn-helix domain-containing protein [Lysinibacillus fusiformis]|uniref:helix-turn-helix domain-containing protein n=1 Tax=Lysinibacillus fusiformis TaxID=28031 RepID=UPI00215AEE77|nr:helix-turn-helix transcriptional regulator [Lysinibacillus fusiformis]MCR8853042.1 helix-turn-helix transcriptional regulator [Lysinibacillus fusiformis]WKT75449.1 helix-turn-helix transcriptional regulator [Lysinibacillus fusiformis]